MDTRPSLQTSHQNRPAAIPVLPLLLFLISTVLTGTSPATAATTSDGLSLTIQDGRVTGLAIDGHSPDFCAPGTGGFYIRDYTLDDQTGLPVNLDTHGNLLACSDFESDCETCLQGQGVWTFSTNPTAPTPDITCASLNLPASGTTTATTSFSAAFMAGLI